MSKLKTKPIHTWYLYILVLSNNGIYVGVARDVDKKYEQHKNGSVAYVSKIFPPRGILYRCKIGDMKFSEANKYRQCVMYKIAGWAQKNAAKVYGGSICIANAIRPGRARINLRKQKEIYQKFAEEVYEAAGFITVFEPKHKKKHKNNT